MASLCVCFGLVTLSHAYVNVALHKPAYQQNAYRVDDLYDASNAVDGNTSDLSGRGGQCVISANYEQTATWWVNLTSIRSIHHITIYYRTDNFAWQPSNGYRTRFLGFSVYVSNTTDKTQGALCFRDKAFTLDTIPSILTVTCPVHGQYVIYYNERLQGVTYPAGYSSFAHNELCEVEVYECSTNEPSCSSTCKHEKCRYCENSAGNCTGCKPGYQGYQCQFECNDGMFGDMCQSQCGHCLDLSKCHHVNGTCLDGCKPGYISKLCNQSCSDGYYGQNCTRKYNVTCAGCNKVNGLCDSGCYPGWKGDYCQTHCNGHLFGENCSKPCGHCLDSIQCHHVNGTCMNGCESGYKGLLCIEACDSHFYGENCSTPCGICLESKQCQNTNGTCMNDCASGYQGPTCKEECKANYFGPNCEEMCNSTCKSCNRTTGTCDFGCQPGWKGLFCVCHCA